MAYIFGAIILAFMGYVVWFLKKSQTTNTDPHELARLRSELERKTEDLGKIRSQCEEERSEKDKLEANGKAMFARFKDLESEYKTQLNENKELRDQLRRFEEAEERRRRELDEQLQKLHRAEKSLDDERVRVRREDEEKKQRDIDERDRRWNDHEQSVVSLLTELCAKPAHAFRSYDNANLPDGFDGSVKPDFMIEFLSQYIVFDAKISRSDNFQNYIATNVKKTASKYKGRTEIYPTIFFVVPTEAISELRKLSHTEGGFTFYIISPESLEPLLASLKKITTYEFAEQLDPEERENIINLIAKMEHHISARNTFDLLLSRMGAELISDSNGIFPELSEEVALAKAKIKAPKFKESEVKRLLSSIEEREKLADELTSPKPLIDPAKVREAQAMLIE